MQAPTHYSLADGQSAQVSYTFAANATDDMTVHLTHAVNHTTATTTRTVNYVVDGGDVTKAPASVVQTVTWNVATDAVTGASVATPTNGYAALTSPAVAGYTASGDVAAMALGAVEATQLADSTTTVHYTADAATLTVTYVDDVTGNTVTTAVLKGTTDGTGTYNVTVPARYALADGQSSSVNYAFSADDSDNVTVHLTHAVGHSTATTTRTINYVVSGDTAKAPASVVQTVTWNVTTDAVTGASYATAQEAYGAVSAPAVAGYTADHGTDAQVMGPVAVEALADTTTTVTYTPNDADITVTYVDDTDGTTVESQTLIRQVDGTGTYTVTVPDGYQLADGQSRSINYVFATDASDNMTVHLAHHVTAGTATTTRTINYVVDGGGTTGPTSVIQTVVFATSTDDVTGLTTATAAGNYAAVATPTVAGYTADTARVTAATPQYADGDAVVTVHYAANAEQLTVRYVDDVTGTTLSTDTITGTMNQSGVYTVTVPDNYALADGQSRAVNYRLTDDDSDDVTVHLTHAMQYGDATTTRTINYVTADGKAGVAPASVTQVAHWRVVTDLATGGSIATATDGYAAVASPTLAGYTTSGNVAAVELGATNTAALQDTSVTVTYTAVAQPDNGGVTTPPATTPDNGGTTTPPATTPDNGGTPTAPVTAPVTTPSGTTTTTATVPVVPNVVATPTTPAVTPTTTTPVAPAVQAGSSTPATPLVATNTATPISAAGVTPDVASMAANIEREAAATSVASTADAAERDVTANVGADITDALNANSTDAVAQRAVTPAGVTATILNVGEQSQNRIPGGSSESTYTYFAQKIADAQTQEAVQYELLLRQWDSGVNNWVLPSSFGITVGMQTTLMQQALRSLDSGNISINLTTSQFTDDTVVQRLSSFARNQQGQGTLTIELAELPSAAQLASVMPTYHDGGVKVVLGDAQDADSSDAARVASQLDGFKFALQKLRARGEDQQWVSAAHQCRRSHVTPAGRLRWKAWSPTVTCR
ncbi:beta strand repeat-containing protein [Lacticaseibacillus pantheris]|uniref:beta strand repeat-containing protein n=1 Tax=Lacticaseibacillus pantheris TaxID=171523 RepID=UPI0012E25748|nr:EAL domain-containing protein [Lacticaseibacillus pantheris]